MCTWKWPVCLVCHWCACMTYAWRCARWKPSITLWISSLLALLALPPYQHHSHHRHLRSRSLANAGVLLNTSTSFIVHCAVARSVFSRTYTYVFTLMCILLSVLWCCWLIGRKGIQPVKTLEWWGAGVVICLEQGADLHMAQLMPLPFTVSCFTKIQIGFTFLVPAYLGSPRKGPLNGCVCVMCILCPAEPARHYRYWKVYRLSTTDKTAFV